MKLTKTAGVLVAVLLVATAGAAALPGNASTDSQAGQADDKYDDDANASNAPTNAGPEMNDSEGDENASNAEDRRGPSTDMPAQAPDRVSQIHELIHQYLDGEVDSLGAQISDLIGGEGDGEDAEDDEDADEASKEDSDESEMDEGSPLTLRASATLFYVQAGW